MSSPASASDVDSVKVKMDEDELDVRDDHAQENGDDNDNDNEEMDDSSEEEDDDDEEEIARVRQGFIVDDDEEEEEDKPRRKLKKRRRVVPDDADDKPSTPAENDHLDEDDLDLLMENTGAPRERHFKRLKRAGDDDSSERSKGLADMFSDEEEQPAPVEQRNEFDDFIEDDEFSEDDAPTRGRESQRESRATGAPAAFLSKDVGIDDDKLNEIYEVFGDGEEYAWALDAEEDRERAQDEYEDEGRAGPELRDVFEPSELRERLLTDEDNDIRARDEPERYQLLRQSIDKYDLSDEDFSKECEWVAARLKSMKKKPIPPHLDLEFETAVAKVLEFIAKENLEVPFIWHHRRDFLTHVSKHEKIKAKIEDDEYEPTLEAAPASTTEETKEIEYTTVELLSLDDLWMIVQLDLDYHGIVEKQQQLERLRTQAGVSKTGSHSFINDFANSASLQDTQDAIEYVQFRFSGELGDLQTGSSKRHSRYARYDRIRASKLYGLVRQFGISSDEFAENLETSTRINYTEDNARAPADLAGDYLNDPSLVLSDAASALESATQMFAMELAFDPRVRRFVRQQFAQHAKIDVFATEAGSSQIDEAHPDYEFKYSRNLSFDELRTSPKLYLQMLQAEAKGLVNVRVSYPDFKTKFIELLLNRLQSDGVSDIASQWNTQRRAVVRIAMKTLVPMVTRSIKEELRNDCERQLFFELRHVFGKKLNQAPFKPQNYEKGTVPRVLALSAGQADFRRDAVVGVFVDEEGRVAERAKLGAPQTQEFTNALAEMVKRRTPDLIAFSGQTVQSHKLKGVIEEAVRTQGLEAEGEPLEVRWVQDEVACLFRNSAGALVEFADSPPLERYCVALARYVQSPLLEYLSLGKEIKAIPMVDFQSLISEDRFYESIDSTFVDYVNLVGVDINEAIRDAYVARMLPYIAGLGPRKASGLTHKIQSRGYLGTRLDLITEKLCGKNVFMNVASFLKLPYDKRSVRHEETELLDATRIHIEDYELAKKMAADALELDEEDLLEFESEGGVIAQLMKEGAEKLNELILEGYAEELEQKLGKKKRYTLEMIRRELIHHYEELREPLHVLTDLEVFTMLTGETEKSLHPGSVVAVQIRRISDRYLAVRLSCGIQGNVTQDRITDQRGVHPSALFHHQQTIRAVVMEVSYSHFSAELSCLNRDISDAQKRARQVKRPRDQWDFEAEAADKSAQEVRREVEQRKTRVIKHPLFKLFSGSDAEKFLSTLPRGELVIRPSSRGTDHIAVTWKVGDGVYQHIDVVELGKENEYALGKTLMVGSSKYSDLDELIAMHVKSMARKVDELCHSDKFSADSIAETEQSMDSYLRGGSKRAIYRFVLSTKKAGYFHLLVKTDQKSPMLDWPVKVIPGGYQLGGEKYPDVMKLCNGFKTLFKSKTQRR
ncbi:Transcription elongation factor SPT6 [Yarrowia sp. C11]|nr:Transcription elongation factor SPT6 [Yarrowia sp. C11]KAG5363939.1 Transcription elongation factor SPT6 [Yarrowia sp. E02]